MEGDYRREVKAALSITARRGAWVGDKGLQQAISLLSKQPVVFHELVAAPGASISVSDAGSRQGAPRLGGLAVGKPNNRLQWR